jgi:urea transport system ATP-binding protein
MQRDALRLEHARVVFDGFTALDIERFSVRDQELRVVIGPNGAGKTTLCDVITGKTPLSAGRVLVRGEDVTGMRDFEIARRGVGRKFQTPSVFGSLTVWENLDLAAPGDPARVEAAADTAGLSPMLATPARFLSHGQRQALEIGMLLAAGSRVLLLDEPAAGLTDHETEKMGTLLRALAAERTIVVIEHDMDFVRALDADITVLNEGRILAEGPMDAIQADARVVEAYLGR